MVEDARPPENVPREGKRRETTVVRQGPGRREALSMMEGDGPSHAGPVEKALASGTLLEGLAGTGAAVLAVLAILGVQPLTLTAVGVLALGGAILLSGGGFAAVIGRSRRASRWGEALAVGSGFEALAGAAVVAGGILILADVVPMTLLPVAVIVLGGCFVMASGGLEFLMASPAGEGRLSEREGSGGAEVAEVLVGLGAGALGVFALAGLNALLFSEVALLALGAGLLAKCMVYSAHAAGRLAHGSR